MEFRINWWLGRSAKSEVRIARIRLSQKNGISGIVSESEYLDIDISLYT